MLKNPNTGWSFLFLSFVLLVPWLGLKQFNSRGESREALVAQSMYLYNDYILPETYDDRVPSKPPLLHWLINFISFVIGDINEFTSRAPLALASIFFGLYFFNFLKSKYEYYWLAPVILITSSLWFRHSQLARVDMLLSVAVSVAMIELYNWYKSNFIKFPTLATLTCGFATLAKGPIGLLPLIIFLAFLTYQKISLKNFIPQLIVVGLLAISPLLIWYGLAYLEHPQKFLDKVWYENVGRLTGRMEDRPHNNSVWYLYLSILVSFLPWTLIALPLIIKSIFSNLLKFPIKSDKFSDFEKLCLFWIFGFLIFFSIPVSKRDVYLMPMFPALAVFLSKSIISTSSRVIYFFKNIFLYLCLLICLIIIAFTFNLIKYEFLTFIFSPKFSYQLKSLVEFCQFNRFYTLSIIAIILIGFACNKLLFLSSDKKNFLHLAYSIFGSLLIFNSILSVAVANSLSYKNIALEVEPLVKDQNVLFSYKEAYYGLSFYLKKKFYSYDLGEDTIKNGLYFLDSVDEAKFKKDFSEYKCVDIIYRSSVPMIKINNYILLAKVDDCK